MARKTGRRSPCEYHFRRNILQWGQGCDQPCWYWVPLSVCQHQCVWQVTAPRFMTRRRRRTPARWSRRPMISEKSRWWYSGKYFLILSLLAQWWKLGPKTNHKNISSKLFLEIHFSIYRCTISALKWYILMSTTSMVSSSLMSLLSTGLSTSNSHDLNVVTNVEIIKTTVMSSNITTAYHTLV